MWKNWTYVAVLSLMVMGIPCRDSRGEQGTTAPATGLDEKRSQGHRPRLIELEKSRVTLIIKTLDPDETSMIFSGALTRNGIQPLLLQIDNRSDQAYAFRKADVEGDVPASQAAHYAYADSATTAVRTTKWLVLSAPIDAVGWAVKSVLRARVEAVRNVTKHKPEENRDIQADFMRMELADQAVDPQGSLIGYVFIHLPQPKSPINIKLTNVNTHEPLVFEF